MTAQTTDLTSDELAATAKALPDRVRLRMPDALAQGRSCCGLPELSGKGISGPTELVGICARKFQERLGLGQSRVSCQTTTHPASPCCGGDQDMHESECEACGDLTANDVVVDCREWHYRSEVHSAPPLPFLVETLIDALLKLYHLPTTTPEPLAELPENLQRYFDDKRPATGSCCC